MRRRALAAAALLAAALPALAYILPPGAIFRRIAAKRASLSLASLEVTGTLEVDGDAAAVVAQAAGLPPGARVLAPARLDLKVPGRCRLELSSPGLAAADRPFVAVRGGRISGHVLDGVPGAVALVRSTCALLAVSSAGDAARSYADALARRGVSPGVVTLGRMDGRIAFVIGGREQDAGTPRAFVDKESFQPERLVSREGGVLLDVRLVDWGSPTGGDWFPRAVEAWQGERLLARFTTEHATANPRLPDSLF